MMSPLAVIPAQFRLLCHAYLFVHLHCMFICLSHWLANSSHTYIRCNRLIATTFTARRWFRYFPPVCMPTSALLFYMVFPSYQLCSPAQSAFSLHITPPSRIAFLRVCFASIFSKISHVLGRKQAVKLTRCDWEPGRCDLSAVI